MGIDTLEIIYAYTNSDEAVRWNGRPNLTQKLVNRRVQKNHKIDRT
jgi:hypothetical protein